MTDTSTTPDDLADALAGPDPDWDTEPAPAIDTDEANRWLWRIRRLDAEAARIRETADAERARIDKWETERLDVITRQRGWLAASCTAFLAAVRRISNDKTKSVSTPNGDIVSTGQQPEWRYNDEEAFIAWANDHAPDLVRRPDPIVPPDAPDKAKAKTALTLPPGKPGDVVVPTFVDKETGELIPVPGVAVEYRPPKYDVKPTVDP